MSKGFNGIYFLDGLKELECGWIKCIERDYVGGRKISFLFPNEGTYRTHFVRQFRRRPFTFLFAGDPRRFRLTRNRDERP